MSAPLHPTLRPDASKVVGSASGFIAVIEVLARSGYAELSVPVIARRAALTTQQTRAYLHTGWQAGWLRPVQDDPSSERIDRWVLCADFAHFAELFRVSILRRAEQLDADFHRFTDGAAEGALSRLVREGDGSC